ncbi:all-trans retinoic acid-induced differentiation factor [Lampris incognitus]|uniref:all-trans retinoic acid-induced differentiation factor n=1 Tax=Lampris incognitus TaxID=2546036 RepID=UPI0024B5F86B|nr:all-trans retinoic acid-induced differentiation factor [Lampris incognitus]
MRLALSGISSYDFKSTKMRVGCFQLKPAAVLLFGHLFFYTSCRLTELQICDLCNGTVLSGTAVALRCASSAGRIGGRCCLQNDNATSAEYVIGLDLSNCSLSHVEDLQGASTALVIDLSLNPITNISDSVFQGFIELNYLILPVNLACPGGNTSWEKEEIRGGERLCQNQRSLCNQTGQMSMNCPENSLCAPFGPGFFECSCAENYHGYKCLREGEFPAIQVFGPLGASTVLISVLLWVTQRRKAKTV